MTDILMQSVHYKPLHFGCIEAQRQWYLSYIDDDLSTDSSM